MRQRIRLVIRHFESRYAPQIVNIPDFIQIHAQELLFLRRERVYRAST